jgi:hypothetical protein
MEFEAEKRLHSFFMSDSGNINAFIPSAPMTERKKASLKNKIKSIKLALTEDKRKWGGQYHDGNGVRYLAPAVYIALQDYKSGMRYVNWFNKHFKDDIGYSIFFFECCLIAFMANKPEQAKAFLFKTKCENPILIPFFLKDAIEWEIYSINTNEADYHLRECEHLPYHNQDPRFKTFVNWLKLVY